MAFSDMPNCPTAAKRHFQAKAAAGETILAVASVSHY